MADPTTTSLSETLLRECLAADPAAWYPREYATKSGADRESLYGPLNDLRIANLITLTEWTQEKGQGYLITPLGKEVLGDPIFLDQLREGKAPASPVPAPQPQATPTRFDIGEAARRALYSTGSIRIAPILILLNLIGFIVSFGAAYRMGIGAWTFLSGRGVEALHQAGAVSADDIARGEWWRLITSCFLHFGLLHLTLNMFSLAILSRVETLWGSGRYVILYLICGLCGSCAGVYYHPGDSTRIVYLAGASGALWGLMAAEATWLLLHRSHLPPGDLRRWLNQLFFTFLLNIGVTMLPGVSAAAHVGGGVAGVAAAMLLQMHRYGPPAKRALAGMLLALLPTLYLLGLGLAMEYDPRLQPFLVKVNREQADEKLGKLPASLESLEPKAEQLHLEESAKRDAAELARLRDGLSGLVKQAKEAREWTDQWSPVGPAKSVREKGLAMLDALIPYAEALDKHAGGVVVDDLNEKRQKWQEARLVWTQAMAN
jgi:rhomboid protease GluP